ncbi:beta-glucosidase [Acutalibacter sp. 1XD8-33]|uniref:glycoside hydrolase family 3 C-terminal domain-containing protein n=1 Tax=Acutalibacter sp. 1XD8-33 TaxID=2320081 RepID=UPI000EA300E4|nr:glycoside hydrolase family 3 C-terminal domain-containing protein [Acutalibacter sp. 1XD8-33]RKJ40325.1 beta-glucosidase [Acutalibacter sp. 1XD8-33]
MSDQYVFQNTALPPRKRAEELVALLTRDEKVRMVTNHLDGVPRLGIPEVGFGVEIARGLVQRNGQRETTILPQPWGMAAMFDSELMEKLGDMAGDEVRISNQMDPPSSLALFGPTVDMERDPRWGRNEEAYGEDPCLTGKLTAAYTRGLRGEHVYYLKSAPLLKHFYANNYENERQTTNANITPRLKREYYLKAFEPAIREGGAVGLMTAYNCINGVEGVNNPDVREICKKEWGMEFALSDGGDFGQNVGAHRSYEDHAHSIADILGVGADMMLDSQDMVNPAVAEALEKGYLAESQLDKALIDMFTIRFMLGEFDPQENPYAHMNKSKLACKEHKKLAVQAAEESMILLENNGLLPFKDDGKCKVAVVGPLADKNYTCWYCGYAPNQTSVVAGLRQKLGENRVLFDEGLDHIVLKSQKTGKYVRLDKNGALMADADTANSAEVFERTDWDYGSWTLRSLKTRKYVTEGAGFAAMQEEAHRMPVNPGLNCVSDEAFGWFVMELFTAKEEDGVLYLSTWQGRDVAVDGEGRVISAVTHGDCGDVKFTAEVVSSGAQRAARLAVQADYAVVCGGNQPLINAREEYDRPDINLPLSQGELLRAVWEMNRNTVLYMITGYPFAIAEEREHAGAVLCSSHLGPCLGHVAANTLFGENVPAGRTPSTWYRSIKDLPSLDDYDIMKNKTTYLYFDGKPLYPFGYGLSYTDFAYSNVAADQRSYSCGDEVHVSVDIENVGSWDGDEVVQLYVVPPKSLFTRPRKMLKAFSRLAVKQGEKVTAHLSFQVEDLAFWDTDSNSYVVEDGEYILEISASSEDIRCRCTVYIEGQQLVGRDGRKPINPLDVIDYRNVEFLTDKRDWQEYLEAKDFRSYAVYQAVDLHGCDGFEVLVSSVSGTVDLILADNATGEILGSCSGPGTGGMTRFAPLYGTVVSKQGPIDLRVCFTKQTALKSLRFFIREK